MKKRVEEAYRSLDRLKDLVSEKNLQFSEERRMLFEKQKKLDRAKRRNVILLIICLLLLIAYRIFLSYEINTLYPDFFGPKRTTDEYGNPIIDGTGIIYWGEASYGDEDIYSDEELEMMVEEVMKYENSK